MDVPYYSPKQYVSSSLLAGNDSLLSASVVAAVKALCGTGILNYESLSILNPSGLTLQATFGTNFVAIFSQGLSQAHGTTPNADTQIYSIGLTPYVPSSGSQTVYVYLTYFSLGMEPVTIVGPPRGHPNYDPTFQPYVANTYNRDSFSLNAGTSLPAGSLEIARTVLTAGQTGGVGLDLLYVIPAGAYSSILASKAKNINSGGYNVNAVDAGSTFDITASGVTVTLQSPTALPAVFPAQTFGFYAGAGPAFLTISGSGVFLGAGVNGNTTINMNQFDFVIVQSDGANYRVISGSPGILGSSTTTTIGSNYYIIKTVDPTTPSGYRIKQGGVTANYTNESAKTITYPQAFSGIFPGAYGTSIVLSGAFTQNWDQWSQVVGVPSTTQITIGLQEADSSNVTWPVTATWFVEGY